MTEPSTLLIATDLSKNSLQATLEGKRWAEARGASIRLLHVFDPAPAVPPLAPLGAGSINAAISHEIEATVLKTLKQISEEHLAGLDVKVDAIQGMSAAATICDYAKQHNVDCIVVSTHGRTGLRHMLLGSVAEKVVRHAPCSVFVVR
ncbi:MAG: universal stress protein [Polyangiales bacterium]